jgi:hypothetical protein
MRQQALVAVAIALITFMGVLLRSREATIRVHDRTTAVLVAQAHMITMGGRAGHRGGAGQVCRPRACTFSMVDRGDGAPMGCLRGGPACDGAALGPDHLLG